MWFKDLLVPESEGLALHVYLFGRIDYRDGLRLQRHLVEEIAERANKAALIICEHPPFVSVGREGDHTQVLLEREEYIEEGMDVQWINRGGGCFLHAPGQLALYPILPLRALGLGLHDYLERLHRVLLAVLEDFSVHAKIHVPHPGLWVGQRLIAGVGVAVRDWVSYHGAILNIAPDLTPFRHFHSSYADNLPMTSLARERHGSPRMAHVRQQIVEHFQEMFRLSRSSLFFSHPLVKSDRLETVESA